MRYFYSADDMRDILSETCQWIECYSNCETPAIRTNCGELAVEIRLGAVQKLYASLKNLDYLVTGGKAMPESCKKLATIGQS